MNSLSAALWQDLLRASWQGGLFILAVYGVCRVFRKMPASVRHWLWWVACLQLPIRLLFLSPVALPLLPGKVMSDPVVAAAQPLGLPAVPTAVAHGAVEPPPMLPVPTSNPSEVEQRLAPRLGEQRLAPLANQMTAREQRLAPLASRMTAGGQRLAPLARQMTAGEQRLAPLARQVTDGEQRLAPLARQMTAGEQRLAPLARQVKRLAPVGGQALAPAQSTANVSTVSATHRPSVDWKSLLIFGWGVGVATVLVLAARRLIRTRKMLDASVPAPGAAEFLTADLSRLLHLTPPTIRESDAAPCPLLAGWMTPTIVLPSGFTLSATAAELQMAVAHELAHLKRRDLWLAATPFLSQAIFYFHPLAWLAIRETAAASEEACDIEAMRLSGGSPSAYARLLLNSAKADAPFVAMGAALGFRLLQRRIRMLNQSNFPARPIARRGYTALVALAMVCSIPWTVTAQTPHKKPHKPAAKKAPDFTKYYITTAGGQRVGTIVLQNSKIGNARPSAIAISLDPSNPATKPSSRLIAAPPRPGGGGMPGARPGRAVGGAYAAPPNPPQPAQPPTGFGGGLPPATASGAAPSGGFGGGLPPATASGAAPAGGLGGGLPPATASEAAPAGGFGGGSSAPAPGVAPAGGFGGAIAPPAPAGGIAPPRPGGAAPAADPALPPGAGDPRAVATPAQNSPNRIQRTRPADPRIRTSYSVTTTPNPNGIGLSYTVVAPPQVQSSRNSVSYTVSPPMRMTPSYSVTTPPLQNRLGVSNSVTTAQSAGSTFTYGVSPSLRSTVTYTAPTVSGHRSNYRITTPATPSRANIRPNTIGGLAPLGVTVNRRMPLPPNSPPGSYVSSTIRPPYFAPMGKDDRKVTVRFRAVNGADGSVKTSTHVIPNDSTMGFTTAMPNLIVVDVDPHQNADGTFNGSFAITSLGTDISIDAISHVRANEPIRLGVGADHRTLFYFSPDAGGRGRPGWVAYTKAGGKRTSEQPQFVVTITVEPAKPS